MGKGSVLKEFANSPREVHALAAGASFGAFSSFLWLHYSRTLALLFGLLFISVVTGIRFYSLIGGSAGESVEKIMGSPTKLIKQLRKEGHYTVTSFAISAAVVLLLGSL